VLANDVIEISTLDMHVWTLFNKLETIAVQQEILVSSIDKYASVQQENPGVALAQESLEYTSSVGYGLASRKKMVEISTLDTEQSGDLSVGH
jgi:hypothetical protein